MFVPPFPQFFFATAAVAVAVAAAVAMAVCVVQKLKTFIAAIMLIACPISFRNNISMATFMGGAEAEAANQPASQSTIVSQLEGQLPNPASRLATSGQLNA